MKAPLIRAKLVLFDLDGTLVDSVPDLAYCVDQMMRQLDRPTWGEARVRDWVGNGVERLVKRALVGGLEGEPDDSEYQRALPLFMKSYSEHNGERSQLYPGVLEGLQELAQRDLNLACVTNKAERFTLPLLGALGIDRYFKLVVSGDTLERKKPDPLPLLHAAGRFAAAPPDCLMVGDSSNDVTAARAAGFQIVCVPYGYNHGQDIRASHPDRVIHSLAELPALLEPIPRSQKLA